MDLNEIKSGEEFLKHLREENLAVVYGVKTVTDAEKLLKGLKASGAPSRP